MATPLNPQQELVTCSLCFEVYNDTDKIPKALPCLHTFCLDCLGKFVRNKLDYQLLCPLCQAKFRIPKKGVKNLPTNFMVTQLRVLENIPSSNQTFPHPTAIWCNQHPEEKCRLVCKTCYVPLCEECLIDIRKGPHTNHELGKTRDVIAALELEYNELQSKHTAMEKEGIDAVRAIQQKSTSCKEKMIEDIECRADSLIAEVVATYKETEENLLKNENELLSANDEIRQRMTQIREHFNRADVEKAKQQLRALSEDIEELEELVPHADSISFGNLSILSEDIEELDGLVPHAESISFGNLSQFNATTTGIFCQDSPKEETGGQCK